MEEYPTRSFNDVVDGHGGFRDSPEQALLHNSDLDSEYFSQFQGLNPSGVRGSRKELFDFLENNVSFIDTFDDRQKPVTYGVISYDTYESMSIEEFHDLLERLANDPILRRDSKKRLGVDIGLVQFMIDDSHKTLEEGPIGLDYQKFEGWEDPDKLRLIQLGATGRNNLTLPAVEKYARNPTGDERITLLASDGRVAVDPKTKQPVYLHTTTKGILNDEDLKRMDFHIRNQLLNGKGLPEITRDYHEQQLTKAMEDKKIATPVNGEPLSLYLLDRTTPEVLREAGNYIYNEAKQAFIDQRKPTSNYDEEVRRLFLLNQADGRISTTVRAKQAVEQDTLV